MDTLPSLPPERKSFLKYWKFGISITYLLIAVLVFFIIQVEKDTANRNHVLRMSADAVEPGKTPPL
jgi:hypothetical protein